ncbi:MAG TPA: NAD(P)-binding domain-containing protein [Bellilinea sp.]|nr:NAD(P)-binding domain-containing protein [Bellilinea sp.]
MTESVETIIIGAGQAGLSLSHYLNQAGMEHLILEKAPKIADAWRNRRWDSFTLVTPNWTFQLPGAGYDGPDPDGFMTKDQIVQRFDQFEQVHHFSIQFSTHVAEVAPQDGLHRYRVISNRGTFNARNVVLATGMFQKVKIPPFATQIPENILQIPSDAYKNPQSLPPGAVLVVGSGQSGCQIAEEINEAGRKVYLSTGSAGRIKRRYRGKDMVHWMNQIKFFDRTPDMLPSPRDRLSAPPHVTGKGGGHDINLRTFHQNGIVLLGHLRGFENGELIFIPDLAENLAKADIFSDTLLKLIDEYILREAIDIPVQPMDAGGDFQPESEIKTLNPDVNHIQTIIWACGFTMENLVQLPVRDEDGLPITDGGVTRFPGLYYLGMLWMNKFKSGLLMGIAESAQHLAEAIEHHPTPS